MTQHPDADLFECYVMDALGSAEAEALEAHVATCNHCATLLAKEGALEDQLSAFAEALDARDARDAQPRADAPRPREGVARTFAAVAVVTAAAAALLFVWFAESGNVLDPRSDPGRAGLHPGRACIEQPHRCLRPNRYGVVRTDGKKDIPRYERTTLLPIENGESLALHAGVL